MIVFKTVKVIASAGLLGLCSSFLLAGDIGVKGNLTATNFIGNGAGLTGVVKTEVDPVVGTLTADKWCKADATGVMINCDQDAPVTVEGVEVGDMQYWDGSAWLLIPAPGVKANMLSNCSGIPVWTDEGCFNIGDTGPAGGTVFYITDGGAHGMEAAPADQSSGVVWGCGGTDLPGADGTAVGTGAQNTADILSGCATLEIAARAADEYILNGFPDWFLPSQDELDLLYKQKAVVGGFASSYYWSSSEYNSNSAWTQHFFNGNQVTLAKVNSFRVRAVRAF